MRDRGQRSDSDTFSWSPDEEVARWFANRLASYLFVEAAVYEVSVRPVAVLALIDHIRTVGGQEREVVVNPNRLRGSQRRRASFEAVHAAAA